MELNLCLARLVNTFTNDIYRIFGGLKPLKKVIIVVQSGHGKGKTVLLHSLLWGGTIVVHSNGGGYYFDHFIDVDLLIMKDVFLRRTDEKDKFILAMREYAGYKQSLIVEMAGPIPPESLALADYVFTPIGHYKFRITDKRGDVIEEEYKVCLN